MGCRFSRTNDTEPEFDSDSADLASGIVIRPLLDTTEYLFDSQSILTSDKVEKLNPTAVSGEDSSSCDRKTITTRIDYIKNTYSLARWDTSIRSTFCNRITLEPKISSDAEVQESNTVYFNKPIKEIKSISQVDFFRMLDEKIAQGPGDLIESDVEK
ncbi:unnamed protein product [Cercopithifilaria johnstoni]|uniref:Uncharacterized protein n=1 Tax=Cercopithifilaria johnstoni TaxID=2874296 RepID=A0A8J2M677_9BILA|nr:unnamed protein product [Cercopithifilaria johnstoni]